MTRYLASLPTLATLAACVLGLASNPAHAAAAEFQFPGLGNTVTVYEDRFGIPTIAGDSEQDVAFVQGYLHARDRFFQMDLTRKQVSGRLAELFGAAALGSDIQFRAIGLGRAALASWQRYSRETQAVLQAYANGVNTYLRNNPLPPEYTVLELTATDPWTPLDSLLVAKGLAASLSLDLSDIDRTITLATYQGFGEAIGFNGAALFFEDTHRTQPGDSRVTVPGFLGSIGGIGRAATERSAPAGKHASGGAGGAYPTVSPETQQLAEDYRARLDDAPFFTSMLQSPEMSRGSNLWAISGAHTASGYPIVANDPHLGLNTPAIWYSAQLVYTHEGESWHVSGVSLPGAPGILIGCNNFACWGYTVNPLDVTDVFLDEVLATGTLPLPTHTVHGGSPEPIRYVYQTYYVNAVGDGQPDNLSRASVGLDAGGIAFVVPRRNNGPILPGGSDGKVLTLQYTGLGPTFELEWARQVNLAGSLEEYRAASQYFDVGTQNAIYADRDGNIAYFTISENPIRADLAAGTVDGLPPYFIRDGSGALRNEWLPVQNPQPQQALPYEIMPFDEHPQVVNPASGYIANANNDPIGVALDNNPLNQLRPGGNGIYYLSPGYAQGYRMGRIDREIQRLIDSGVPITMEDIMTLQGNAQQLDAELTLPTLLAQFQGLELPPEAPMAQALDVLSTWDYSTPTGIAEGFDAGDDPWVTTEPDLAEIRNSAAATIFATWRSMLVSNTIDATLTAVGLGAYLPGGSLAWNAFRHHLDNYPTRGGIGASGLPFFAAGLAPTVQGSLQQALDLLASDEFAPAFGNSLNVLDYRWGKLHRIVFDHPLGVDPFNIPNGGGFSDLEPALPDSGPENARPRDVHGSFPGLPGIARQGGYEVVDDSDNNVRARTLNGYMFGSGPSRRFIGEMGPGRIHAVQVIPGGQSGIFLHPNYASQLPLWLTNNYLSMAMGEADAAATAVLSYRFGPIDGVMTSGIGGEASRPAPAGITASEGTDGGAADMSAMDPGALIRER
ncbi:MAG: penicillin acylase family protein [Xanthomonadales bacterium]|nr:penicillin acylase family protein [Xanthomonadales bacterium]NIN58235.1 penicillin acylase family protein [Xanthomonadales bacterium]NIN73587.1 penicillin acylase family protein [Xanthomonadales bacterium]NIO13702.1 penicillin acylase family protein [Xanthomonadales bacterium]NIP10628.1 penicillin acylase family protein [Xanthomonadales bacterium]